jgi:maleylpyruvate isomerase
LKLYTYFRSSATYRVRIALNLKRLDYESIPVHLLREGGGQHKPDFVEMNPAHLVPVLQDESLTVTQSLAIMEYLEETHPSPPLLPPDPAARAYVRSLALSIACDIHPLNNLRVLQHLESTFGVGPDKKAEWSRHWITLGFAAIERMLVKNGARLCCFGDTPTLADCCLIPQVFNAMRVGAPLAPYPSISRIYEHCTRLPEFARAAPGAQIDAE